VVGDGDGVVGLEAGVEVRGYVGHDFVGCVLSRDLSFWTGLP
jgi:hypothetical protein